MVQLTAVRICHTHQNSGAARASSSSTARFPLLPRPALDDPGGGGDDPGGVVEGLPGLIARVALGRDPVGGPVERQLPVQAQVGRDPGKPFDVRGDGLQPVAVLAQEAADVVPVRGFDPDLPQYALQRQLDEFLGLPDNVGACLLVKQHRQGLEPPGGLDEMASGERMVGHGPSSLPPARRRRRQNSSMVSPHW